ncbi:unnamed protein product [Bemisia tabaci]|uniref:Deoxyribodipyrimidine photo-lyase n=1 Tax=Bemisia tabaci TaxID=7038 RepID=A0A9P0AA75_BEMTA|nr:unnamed protein product [Bemisia tabaci]
MLKHLFLPRSCSLFQLVGRIKMSSAPPAKKAKAETSESSNGSSSSEGGFEEFLKQIEEDRKKAAKSVLEFKFNKKRVRILSKSKEVPEWGKGVIYWTFRDQRIHDNWAFLFAQKLALKNDVPLHFAFCRLPKFLDATLRHFKFIFEGLKETEKECKKLNIQFHFLIGCGKDVLPDFVKKHKLGAVVIDFMPLRGPMAWADELSKSLPDGVPLVQVDAHNIVPVWETSEKLEYAARTIRNKVNGKLPEFLTQYPPVIKHPHSGDLKASPIDWEEAEKTLEVDKSVGPVKWAKPGYRGGMQQLYTFVTKRIKNYGTARNDPNKNALSMLSPWFHFGHISVQRAILEVKKVKGYSESVAAFCEEAIVRRELSDNFCFYNKNYDSIKGAYDWAKKTLKDHSGDKRPYLYTKAELEQGHTHDDLWNAAQNTLINDGKIHGFMRMYWAKKILEWTESPEQALQYAIYLNDKYSLDGRDPNGFVGCMWSICGIHDQGWSERAVFGKIRYMNYEGCKRKFDINGYIIKHGGKVYTKGKENTMDKFLKKKK